jgi:hypothetical protein
VRYAEQEYAEVAEITQRAQRKAGGEGEKARRGEEENRGFETCGDMVPCVMGAPGTTHD